LLELIDSYPTLDVDFIFVQSKTSEKLDTGDFGKFIHAVAEFFREKSSIAFNDTLQKQRENFQALLTQSNKFKRRNPSLKLFYVSASVAEAGNELLEMAARQRETFETMALFSNVSISPMNATALQSAWRRSISQSETTIEFPSSVALPDVNDVEQSFIGFLDATELIKLLRKDDGDLNRRAFYENVRDYQGDTPTNLAIRATLESERKNEFILRNNGITIICRSINRVGTKSTLSDYQIVNGCQTCHVIWDMRDNDLTSVVVPIRLVATQDSDIRSAIIHATNSSNTVRADQFWAMSDFHKDIENYFEGHTGAYAVHYERRAGQFEGDATVEKVRIVKPVELARLFYGIVSQTPHIAARYQKEVITHVGRTIFSPSHVITPYFWSALLNIRLDRMFRSSKIDTRFKPFRYHILLAARMEMCGPIMPALSDLKAMEKYFQPMNHIVENDEAAQKLFETVCSLLEQCLKGLAKNFDRDSARTQDVSTALIEHYGKQKV
jgi:hypothetical protein